jgi:hypothetical protein
MFFELLLSNEKLSHLRFKIEKSSQMREKFK